MTKYTTVAGTAGLRKNDWWKTGSSFRAFLDAQGLEPVKPGLDFIWSTDLDGFNPTRYIFFKGGNHNDWEAGGKALTYYLENVPVEDRNIISHSHGRQVVLYAASSGLKINNYVDIAGPIRKDVEGVARIARPNIKSFLHIAARRDLWQILGELFDGHLGPVTKCPVADINITLSARYGHGDILRKQDLFPMWLEYGFLFHLVHGAH